ncbi:hypothetical protein QTH87_18030 [Variovorax sp. J22P168]|uniref:hypothetical protein n=1 Tax=Variovorax jilinensis TaxID=3053513 RepID=UPI00257544F6|nr:hypothetical protein [Variovorax sp. J22P168]MDM0014344.1 hypothetical protein [Variovorax sp. J22P168]
MTSFVHVDQPISHPGVERAEAVVERVRAARRGFDGARGLSALLLAAIVSSMLVVADKLVATTDEGGLLMAWVLWGVAFFGLALFAGTARSLAVRVIASGRAGAARRAAARADEKFLAYAQHDPRILSELNIIATHQQQADVEAPLVGRSRSLDRVAERSANVRIPSLYEAMRRVNLGQYY